MMTNPYKVLGVTPEASPEEIKTAYRTLAKKYHPDLNPGDPTAAEKMNDINVAYDILSKPHTAGFERQQARERANEQRTYQQAYQQSYHQTYQQTYAEESYEQPRYEYENPFGNNSTQWQWQWQTYSPYQRNQQNYWTPAPRVRITIGKLIKWFFIWQIAAMLLKIVVAFMF